MPRVTFGRLSKRKSHTRKRRSSTTTRARYMPKTTRANRSLIKSNARDIRIIRRMIPPSVYCDFQYTNAYAPFLTDIPPGNYFNILTADLMSPKGLPAQPGQAPPILWDACLRQDPNVLLSSQTLVKRMAINFRYSLGQSNWVQISNFVVTIRKDAANRVINQANLTPDEDYIYNDQNYNPRLNPAVFKVHYVRHLSLMSNAWMQPKATVGTDVFAGNPNTTWAKGSCNIHTNVRMRQPIGTPWIDMNQSQLPPHQRYYLLTFFKGQSNNPDDDPPRLDWDALYTTFNSS